MRVLAALSGGVDSAVAAAKAQAAGHDVTCVHMALMRDRPATRAGSRGCCSIEDASDARRAADKLGLDFYVWDLSEEFEDLVVRDFLDSYAAGLTPNPCVRCNEFVKFQVLLERGVSLGFDAVATGHYARVEATRGAGVTLRRARDLAKDQSYVLAAAGPEALRRCLFPLGAAPSKAQVRAEAAALGLPMAEKPDSYDICFVADGDTRGFLRARLGPKPGPILDQTGAQVGAHEGAYQFTVGQRRGLRLGRPAADGRPRYVTGVDTAAGVVRVGPASLLDVASFAVGEPVWFDGGAAQDLAKGGQLACAVQIRAHGAALGCRARLGAGDALEIVLDAPTRGVAAGQTAVLFDGDRVLGSGVIERAPAASANS
ncbi:MAG: tRNA 2-thiouridine(34) synthase MnmA [Bifidobacteriaceae bacterium]|jgi:tRNA-specific 2-thiouridylase|nr:tRNA 2-thiouridine(34) synthase MnmA [Bifidobacteriaceae bacterium]